MMPNGWELITLDDLKSDKLSYGANSPSCELKENGTRYIRITDIDDSGKLNSSAVGIDSDDYQDYILENNDFLFARSGNTVGKTFLYEKDKHPKAAYAGYLIRYRANQERLNAQYLKQFCFSNRYHFWVKSQLRAGAQPNINAKEYGSLELPLPEQRKIAKILSTWDKAITTAEKLIETSKQQKKALMQQLLTGKKRLGIDSGSYCFQRTRYGDIPQDWEYPSIREICTQFSQKNTESKDLPVLSCSKHLGFVDSLKYFKKKVYSDDTSGYKVIPLNFFGFPSNHIEEGSIGLQRVYDYGIVSPIYVVFQSDRRRVDNEYLFSVLKTEHYRQIFCAATNASVDRRGSLRWKEFSAIHVPLPPLEEQQKIAAVLKTADKEIEVLQAKLAHFKQEKKALMQQLLTGKRRVKVDEEVAA